MIRLPVAAFNFNAGGRQPDGSYNMRLLQQAFADVDEPPALVLFCEAKWYRDNGNAGLHAAAEALTDQLDTPYIGLLGTNTRGPIPPAIFYDPTRLILRSWWAPDDPGAFDDQVNTARFTIQDGATTGAERAEFIAWVDHWDPRSGIIRRQEAGRRARYGRTRTPVLGGGDLNATASGPHLPQRDWATADCQRRSEEAHLHPDGTWTADTDAVDHLIGRWDTAHNARVDGCGYHAIAEIARHANPDQILHPTINDGIDTGGAIIKDWLLVNTPMAAHVDPTSYRVHIPPGNRRTWPSDHRLVTAAIDLPHPPGAAL